MQGRVRQVGLGLCLFVLMLGSSGTGAVPGILPEFISTWQRTDRPVADGQANRTWMWGPGPLSGPMSEPYLDAPGGERMVQYFDKSRMEITDPDADPGGTWYVTNGLLARELITGEMQIGDDAFEQRSPAEVHIAGDAHPESPTYATFAVLLDAPALAVGSPITQAIDRDGTVGEIREDSDVVAEHYVQETDHTIASVFWEFMQSHGPVAIDGSVEVDQLFESPFFAVGFPITEAYWMHVPVGGEWKDVLTQCFERRCLTYTPGNPEGWQVEAGNIGQHYYTWRYGEGAPGADDSGDPLAPPDDEDLGPPIPGACEADGQAVLSEVIDSLGNANSNSWAKGTGGDWPAGRDDSPTLIVGQEIELVASAEGDCEPLEYRFQRHQPEGGADVIRGWSENPSFSYTVQPADVGEHLVLVVDVRNQDPRTHFHGRDDYTYLTYRVE